MDNFTKFIQNAYLIWDHTSVVLLSNIGWCSDVRLGEAHVGQLEKALETCHSELQDHVSKIEADSTHHEEVVMAYKHQVRHAMVYGTCITPHILIV